MSSDERIERARTLSQALPYLQRLSGTTIVVKLGGAAIDAAGYESVLRDMVLLRTAGVRPVLVHGGGPAVSAWQARLGLSTRFVEGLRVSDAETVELARMVLTGKVGPELVGAIHRLGGSAVGISGEDGPTLLVRPHPLASQLGYVGEVDRVVPDTLLGLLDDGHIPVVASIGLGPEGRAYNVNADTVAAELAATLPAGRLVLLTDVEGVRDARGELIPELSASRAAEMLRDGTVSGGMIPKLVAGLRALDGGATVHIIDGRVEHALLLELLTDTGVGTMLRAELIEEAEA
ncbi:MAG: acetylglutamate kinase [Candidatus Dormibacteria bacterium]